MIRDCATRFSICARHAVSCVALFACAVFFITLGSYRSAFAQTNAAKTESSKAAASVQTKQPDDAKQLFQQPKSADELVASLLAVPAKSLAQTQVLRGKFVHKKYLSDIPAPLEAVGEFVFIREQGLYWHTQKPFDSVFVLTPKGMVQQDESGKAIRMTSVEQPAVRAAAQIFMALFSVDLKSLDRDFLLFGRATPGGWQLGLRPRNAAMSAVFSEAIVNGAAQADKIELHDSHGDRTVIQLQDAQLLSRPPTAQELALLAR